jgi:hypothetical protein
MVQAVSARQRPAAVPAFWAGLRWAVVVLVVVRQPAVAVPAVWAGRRRAVWQRPGAERRPADKAQAPAVLPPAAGAAALPRAAM